MQDISPKNNLNLVVVVITNINSTNYFVSELYQQDNIIKK